jgi:Plasmid pRiA4b ORF-3-like protein
VVFQVPTAVQLRVTLDEIEPPVWRRLVVPIGFHLGQLHLVIQAAFGWLDYHRHEFRIGGLAYSDPELVHPEFEGDPTTCDESQVRLQDFQPGEPVRFLYIHDFGDDWHHIAELEQPLVLEPPPRVARCLDGARARPPEDVGGPDGYARFLEVLADPRHDEHGETKRWAGGHFDPAWFDLRLCDPDVRRALRADRPLRLRQPRPRRQQRAGGEPSRVV